MIVVKDERPGVSAWKTSAYLPMFDVDPSKTALIVIDMTLQQAHRDYGVCKKVIAAGLGDDLDYFLGRVADPVLPSMVRLIDTFHRIGQPVVHTRCVSLRGDGSDQTWRHREFGLVASLDDEQSQFLPQIAPQKGDIVLNKTGSGLFNSTNAEHLFRNMGITTLVMTGIFTNSCVETATRDGGDRDFRVLLAEDACAAMSPSGHAQALDYLDANFCHVKSSDEIIALVGKTTAAAAA